MRIILLKRYGTTFYHPDFNSNISIFKLIQQASFKLINNIYISFMSFHVDSGYKSQLKQAYILHILLTGH